MVESEKVNPIPGRFKTVSSPWKPIYSKNSNLDNHAEHLLNSAPESEHERIVIDELLYLLVGMEGEIITRKRKAGALIEPPVYLVDPLLCIIFLYSAAIDRNVKQISTSVRRFQNY